MSLPHQKKGYYVRYDSKGNPNGTSPRRPRKLKTKYGTWERVGIGPYSNAMYRVSLIRNLPDGMWG